MKFTRQFLFLLFVFLLPVMAIVPVFAQTGFNENTFRNDVKSYMDAFKVPGTAILIIKDDKVIFSEGFGYRDVEKKLPVTPSTLFPIGSITKSFTAFSIGLLVDEKKVAWMEPVRNYLPDFRMEDPCRTETVTPVDLLTHRTGLPRYDLLWYCTDFSREQLMNKIRYLEPTAGLRERFQYNNLMYLTSGVLIKEVSGKTWEDFVRARILVPLGMNDSNFSVDDSKQTADYSLPYKFEMGSFTKVPDDFFKYKVHQVPFHNIGPAGPAGSISSNLTDMEKWLRLHMNEGKLGDVQLLQRKTSIFLHSPRIVTANLYEDEDTFPEISFQSYGLGWFIQSYRGRYMVHHGGNIDGFSALASFMPREKVGIIVLTNMDSTPFTTAITYAAYDNLLGLDPLPWSERMRQRYNKIFAKAVKEMGLLDMVPRKDAPLTHPIKEYAGRYIDPVFGTFTVTQQEKGLQLSFCNKKFPLEHLYYDIFVIRNFAGGMPIRVKFLMNDSGKIVQMSIQLEDTVKPFVFDKETPKEEEQTKQVQRDEHQGCNRGDTSFEVHRG